MVTDQPTQVRRPWRAVIRTVFQLVVALAAALPLILASSGVEQKSGAVAVALTIAGGITRIMAIPAVEDFLRRFVPWLAADPDPQV